ncbi:zinc-binding dehydrogenase [candidate division GN15 bacterium]|nr:zinc-binding dehydrogenase [candidate division GN15 bacterium]
MKAIVSKTYGPPDVMELEDVPTPTPDENRVLIRVKAASINAFDWHMMRADPFFVRLGAGFFKPKRNILGADAAGIVEAVGSDVKHLKVGDEVYADTSGCLAGSFAEYVSVRETVVAPKPSGMTFEEAAAVPLAAVTALQSLRDRGNIQAGQKLLINGASGGVGTFAVQIAKALGARVTGVCSTRNVDMVRSLGADHVIDYTREDFTRSNERYDLILAANGNRSVFAYKRALTPNGTFVIAGGTMRQFYQYFLLKSLASIGNGKKLTNILMKPNRRDLEYMTELIEAGKVRAVIDKKYPLDGVPDAIRYMEQEHTRGKVVITMSDSDEQ